MNTNDADKIAALYHLYEQAMYYEARAILHDDHQAEDAVHEAFVRLIRKRSRIGDPASDRTRAYVQRTLRSTAIDLYRKNRREREHACDPEVLETVTDDSDILPFDAGKLIGRLPNAYADAARCRFLHGLSVRETAAVLKISEACVRKRCERARRMLQEML